MFETDHFAENVAKNRHRCTFECMNLLLKDCCQDYRTLRFSDGNAMFYFKLIDRIIAGPISDVYDLLANLSISFYLMSERQKDVIFINFGVIDKLWLLSLEPINLSCLSCLFYPIGNKYFRTWNVKCSFKLFLYKHYTFLISSTLYMLACGF